MNILEFFDGLQIYDECADTAAAMGLTHAESALDGYIADVIAASNSDHSLQPSISRSAILGVIGNFMAHVLLADKVGLVDGLTSSEEAALLSQNERKNIHARGTTGRSWSAGEYQRWTQLEMLLTLAGHVGMFISGSAKAKTDAHPNIVPALLKYNIANICLADDRAAFTQVTGLVELAQLPNYRRRDFALRDRMFSVCILGGHI